MSNALAATLQAHLAKMARNPMVAMSGHSDTLKAVSDYIGSQDARLTKAETDIESLRAQVKNLQGMGGAVDQFKLGMIL
jgi:hypothetical protein